MEHPGDGGRYAPYSNGQSGGYPVTHHAGMPMGHSHSLHHSRGMNGQVPGIRYSATGSMGGASVPHMHAQHHQHAHTHGASSGQPSMHPGLARGAPPAMSHSSMQMGGHQGASAQQTQQPLHQGVPGGGPSASGSGLVSLQGHRSAMSRSGHVMSASSMQGSAMSQSMQSSRQPQHTPAMRPHIGMAGQVQSGQVQSGGVSGSMSSQSSGGVPASIASQSSGSVPGSMASGPQITQGQPSQRGAHPAPTGGAAGPQPQHSSAPLQHSVHQSTSSASSSAAPSGSSPFSMSQSGAMKGGAGQYSGSSDILAMLAKGSSGYSAPAPGVASSGGVVGAERDAAAPAQSSSAVPPPQDLSEFPALGSAADAARAKHLNNAEYKLQSKEDFPALGKAVKGDGMEGNGKEGERRGGEAQRVPGRDARGTAGGAGASGVGRAMDTSYGLLGLLGVIRMTDPDVTMLAVGTDLTTLGLNLNSTESLNSTFTSPFADAPSQKARDYHLPLCYYQPPMNPPSVKMRDFSEETLFYIFYNMPKDALQTAASVELYNRDWRFHRELGRWIRRVPNSEGAMKTSAFERGSFVCFEPSTWGRVQKDNFTVQYDQLEERKSMPSDSH